MINFTGMIAKKDLISGRWYYGNSRNAFFAVWDGEKERFFHLRNKLGMWMVDDLPHPDDDEGFDVFIPLQELDISRFPEEEV